MDAQTIRIIAGLAMQRSARSSCLCSGDGLSRLGASRALGQLARDLEAMADELDREAGTGRKRQKR